MHSKLLWCAMYCRAPTTSHMMVPYSLYECIYVYGKLQYNILLQTCVNFLGVYIDICIYVYMKVYICL